MMDRFFAGYVCAALWTFETPNLSADDIHPATLAEMIDDCAAFFAAHGDVIEGRDNEAGSDFWLTRNRHGAGFWDGDWAEPLASTLTEAAHKAGSFELYQRDDGRIGGGR